MIKKNILIICSIVIISCNNFKSLPNRLADSEIFKKLDSLNIVIYKDSEESYNNYLCDRKLGIEGSKTHIVNKILADSLMKIPEKRKQLKKYDYKLTIKYEDAYLNREQVIKKLELEFPELQKMEIDEKRDVIFKASKINYEKENK